MSGVQGCRWHGPVQRFLHSAVAPDKEPAAANLFRVRAYEDEYHPGQGAPRLEWPEALQTRRTCEYPIGVAFPKFPVKARGLPAANLRAALPHLRDPLW